MDLRGIPNSNVGVRSNLFIRVIEEKLFQVISFFRVFETGNIKDSEIRVTVFQTVLGIDALNKPGKKERV
jgi:hypothetical protein